MHILDAMLKADIEWVSEAVNTKTRARIGNLITGTAIIGWHGQPADDAEKDTLLRILTPHIFERYLELAER